MNEELYTCPRLDHICGFSFGERRRCEHGQYVLRPKQAAAVTWKSFLRRGGVVQCPGPALDGGGRDACPNEEQTSSNCPAGGKCPFGAGGGGVGGGPGGARAITLRELARLVEKLEGQEEYTLESIADACESLRAESERIRRRLVTTPPCALAFRLHE